MGSTISLGCDHLFQIQIHGILPSSSHSGQGAQNGTTSGANGTGRPRVRARRGQATDPHSIAERVCICMGAFVRLYVLRLYGVPYLCVRMQSLYACMCMCTLPCNVHILV
jgi:hypothetical protein